MAMGQAAGVAACISIDLGTKIRNVPMNILQNKLLQQDATLFYVRDVAVGSPDFKMVQTMGLAGYLPGWDARLDAPVDAETATLWSGLSHTKVETGLSRREALQKIWHLEKLVQIRVIRGD
jgi:hypothetical protein